MNTTSPLARIIAPILPLIAIALIAGAAGYAFKRTSAKPLPPLIVSEQQPAGASGIVASIASDQIVLTTSDGARLTYPLGADVKAEVLKPLPLAQVAVGDWINGGAILHPQTTLVLTRLIVIPNPVVSP